MYGIILWNYQKCIQNIYKMYHFHIQISYRAGNCYSEKINWLKDTVEPLQILKRSTKQPEIVESVAPLKRATFRHPVE